MEGNLNMMPSGGPYASLEFQGSMRNYQPQQRPHMLHQQHQAHRRQSVLDVFSPLTVGVGAMQDCDQISSMADNGKGERAKNTLSDEDEPSFTEEVGDEHNNVSRGRKGSPWQRVKWTDKMVRLLITAVSYLGEDASSESSGGGRRKCAILQKKGKWKSISKVMAERGFYVSPQQCEDKFNDLNKRYKRLNDILGRGTSCEVVENPALLDMMDHLSEKTKEDVRKILSSKQLFYEEMCSYHNSNRLHLPPDPALQRSLQLALRARDESDNNDVRRQGYDDIDEDDQDGEADYHDGFEESHAMNGDGHGIYRVPGGSSKRKKIFQEFSFVNTMNSREGTTNYHSPSQISYADLNQEHAEGSRAAWLQNQRMKSRSVDLEERKLDIQMEMLELEKQRIKWQKFSKKKDRELDKLRMENERMRLENERMGLDLKRKETSSSYL